MALHVLTADERSQFENKIVALHDTVTKLESQMLNMKAATGNDTAMGLTMKSIQDQVDAIATLIGVAVAD